MMAEAMKVTGGCLCGLIRYEAEAFLRNGYLCHCAICQKSTGQPAEITVLIKAGTLKYLSQEPKYYVSSASGKRGFCPECGSRLVWQAIDPADDWQTNLTIGCLDNAGEAQVTCHIYTETQVPWFDAREDLPKFTEETADAMMKFFREQVRPE